MKIDPNSLISQFIDYHTSMVTSWVTWVKLERSMAGYQKTPSKKVASNGMFVFSESRLDEFLTDRKNGESC